MSSVRLYKEKCLSPSWGRSDESLSPPSSLNTRPASTRHQCYTSGTSATRPSSHLATSSPSGPISVLPRMPPRRDKLEAPAKSSVRCRGQHRPGVIVLVVVVVGARNRAMGIYCGHALSPRSPPSRWCRARRRALS